MSFKEHFEVSLTNVFPGALKEDKFMTRRATRRITHPGMPCPSYEHIDEDFGGQDPTLENSNSCGSTPVYPLGICNQSLAYSPALQTF
ncbi:hypothetical protein LIER_27211 [Lithospermum erythrorhizon]|uniref:Uncharacterized protein n=1 Tax=Lithospermum erythrorhizon TaxID=34254 RepID=A0AAV3RD90_LITER